MTRHPLDPTDQREHPQEMNTAADPSREDSLPSTDSAWQKMQSLLEKETPHPNWEKWSDPAFQIKTNQAPYSISNLKGMNTTMNSNSSNNHQEPTRQEVPAAKSARNRKKANPARRRWVTGIAACAIAGVVITTPFGNNALASLLNQFRMQELTAVNDQDLDQMFSHYKESGVTEDDINRFGSFTDSSGKIEGAYPAKKAADMLGYTYMASLVENENSTVSIDHSNTQTLRMNVNEVNKAIQQLGGTTLLPESMNQKPITIHMPETILYPISEGNDKYGMLYQSGLPKVTFDPSINTEEAFTALLNLPFLPDSVKTTLQKEKLLTGELPLPVVSNTPAERVMVDGVPVIITANEYENKIEGKQTSWTEYTAYWTKDNQMFTLYGETYDSQDKMIHKVKELIQS